MWYTVAECVTQCFKKPKFSDILGTFHIFIQQLYADLQDPDRESAGSLQAIMVVQVMPVLTPAATRTSPHPSLEHDDMLRQQFSRRQGLRGR